MFQHVPKLKNSFSSDTKRKNTLPPRHFKTCSLMFTNAQHNGDPHKQSQTTSASHAAPPANDAEAAPAADGKVAPAAVAKAAAAPPLLPARLLALQAENICRLFLDAGSFLAQVPGLKYCVVWEITLGKGTWGTVHKGFRHSVPRQEVAIKIMNSGNKSERADSAEAEVRRYATLPGHPNVVKLLDIEFFPRHQQPTDIGLVFECFDINVRELLKLWPLKAAGVRHVLRGVLAALACMHEHGLVHADVKTDNILMRGVGARSRRWFARTSTDCRTRT
jgi:hypothetical protein